MYKKQPFCYRSVCGFSSIKKTYKSICFFKEIINEKRIVNISLI